MRRFWLLLVVSIAVPVGAALASGNPHTEKRHHTSADMARAKHALLRPADLGPDWIRLPYVSKSDSSLDCPGFDPDFSRFTITGEAYSLYSFKSLDSIVSSAEVYASKAQATADFKLGAKPQLAGCLRHVLLKAFRAASSTVKVVSLSSRMVRAPKIGERAVAYHLTAALRTQGVTIRAYLDMLAFQRNRTLAGLLFTGIDGPVSSQLSYARAVDARMRSR